MTDLQAVRDNGRTELHRRMSVPANFYTPGSTINPEEVTVRVRKTVEPVGDLSGTGEAFATRWEENPVLIFLIAEHRPQRGNVYCLAADIAYRVESVEPRDGVTQSASAVLLSATQAANYEAPD